MGTAVMGELADLEWGEDIYELELAHRPAEEYLRETHTPRRDTYYEYFSNTYRAFYYVNHDSGHETYSEPDEEINDIVRYCVGEGNRCKSWYPSWFPEPPPPLRAPSPVTDVLETDCSVIPAVMPSRTPSACSMVSMRDLPEQVELGKPYRALLSHLQQTEVPDLQAWRRLREEQRESFNLPEPRLRSVMADEEMPEKLMAMEVPEIETPFLFAPKPRPTFSHRTRRWILLSALGGSAIAFAIFCLKRA